MLKKLPSTIPDGEADQCLAQGSWEMISTAAHWSKYKDPHPDIMQRERDFGTLSHKQDVSIIFPFSEISNPWGRSVKNRNDGRHQKKKKTL